MLDKPNKICPVCGKPYEYQLQTGYDQYHNQFCKHDDEFKATTPDFSPQRVKNERKTFEKDILQPFKRDGSINEKFQKAYGSDHSAYKPLNGKKNVNDII